MKQRNWGNLGGDCLWRSRDVRHRRGPLPAGRRAGSSIGSPATIFVFVVYMGKVLVDTILFPGRQPAQFVSTLPGGNLS